jgi:iron complex outermembrane receptor protein
MRGKLMKWGNSAKTSVALLSAATCFVMHAAAARPSAEQRDNNPQQTATQGDNNTPQTADQGNNAVGGLEEIVVYSQRKAVGEYVQRVPLSVTGVGGATIENMHIEDLTQLGRLAPNVTLDNNGTFPLFPSFYIRGIGVSTTVRSIDPAINIIQDGMVIGYQAGAMADPFDLEGVEILRGPQGVLFGRNASGGAVVMRTARPTDDFQAKAEVTLGNADTVEFKGSVGGALIEDTLLAKIAFMSKDDSGLWNNTLDGTFVPTPLNPSGRSPQHAVGGIGQVHEYTVKPTFVFNAAENVHFTLFTQYQKANDGAGPIYAIPDPPGAPPSALKTVLGYTPSTNPYTVNISNPGYIKLEAGHAIGELVVDNVGGGTWTTVAAYRRVIYDSTQEADGTPFTLYVFGPDSKESNHQYSLESRYNTRLASWLDLLVGVYAYHARTEVLENQSVNGLLAHETFADTVDERANWRQNDDTVAGFTNVDIRPLERLTVSAGMRYGWERKQFDIIPVSRCAGPDFTNCPTTWYDSSRHWEDLSPRGVISYALTDENMIYGNYSKGFRSGNYNGRATTPQAAITPANPEKVDSYEIGTKNDFFSHRLRANLAGFYEIYNDIQRPVLVTYPDQQPVQNLVNAAKARVYGAELELSWLPVDSFRLDTNAGYTQSHLDSFTGLTLPPGLTVDRLQLDHVSKWTINAAGTYSFRIPAFKGDWDLRTSYTYRTRFFEDAQNTPYFVQPSFGILDASLTYTIGQWKISGFGRNLQNTVYSDFMTRVLGYNQGTGQPRTYGLQVSVRSP